MKRNYISNAFLIMATITMLGFWGCSNSTDPPGNGGGPTEAQLQQLEDIQQTQLEYYGELENLLAEMDTVSAKDSIITIMLTDASIEWTSVTSQGINIQWEAGFRGTLLLDPKRSSGDLSRGNAKNGNITLNNTATGSVCPKSKNTIFLAPFYTQFSYWDDQIIDAANAVFAQAGYDNFEVYKNAECVFGWFNTIGLLDDFGIIRISSHGTTWPSDADIQNVYLWTGEPVNRTTNRRIYDHLADGFAHIGTIDSVTYYTIEGGFFAAANDLAENKPFVSLAFCYSALGNWPAHIINCGASAVTAYSWSVFATEEADWMQDFFEQMCDTSREEPLTIGEWDISDDRLYYDSVEAHWVALLYSGPDSMTLWEPFRISSIDPTSGSEDTIVTIRGIGFGDTEVQVRFDAVVATDISVWTDTLIRVAVPAGLTEGEVAIVKVVVDGKETNGVNFTVESDIDLSGYDRVQIQIQYISSSWAHSDGDTTGSPSRSIDTGSLYGSFSGHTFHHYLDTIPAVGQELITEVTVTLNSSATAVSSFEYTLTGTNTDGYINFFTVTGTVIPVLGAGYNFFRLEGMGVCGIISNMEERTDYPGGIWAELIEYGCNENSRIQIIFF